MFERALALWKSREPRARWARWVQFVADRKLLKRADKRFFDCSSAKMLRRMRANTLRRQQMRVWMLQARNQRERWLKRWVLAPWRVFFSSSLLMYARFATVLIELEVWKLMWRVVVLDDGRHEAAARRGERFRRQVLLTRSFRVLLVFYQVQ